MTTLLQNIDFWNLIIAFVALIISIIALAHSIIYNMVKLKISNPIKSRYDTEYDWLYSFEISNLSGISVIITKVELYNHKGELLLDNGFDPQKLRDEIEKSQPNSSLYNLPSLNFIDPYWWSSPFKKETEIFPNNKVEFTYYLNDQPHLIKVYTDKRIYRLRKYQSFSVRFDYDE